MRAFGRCIVKELAGQVLSSLIGTHLVLVNRMWVLRFRLLSVADTVG